MAHDSVDTRQGIAWGMGILGGVDSKYLTPAAGLQGQDRKRLWATGLKDRAFAVKDEVPIVRLVGVLLLLALLSAEVSQLRGLKARATQRFRCNTGSQQGSGLVDRATGGYFFSVRRRPGVRQPARVLGVRRGAPTGGFDVNAAVAESAKLSMSSDRIQSVGTVVSRDRFLHQNGMSMLAHSCSFSDALNREAA
jgi:hypothetical protein